MKTTDELSEEMLRSAKTHAANKKITLRALIERGLHLAIQEDQAKGTFVLRDASVDGEGLNPELKEWCEIRSLIYESRGGDL